MIISSWNVNSVRARIENITDYLKKFSPDIIMMQEIKTEDQNFPYDDFKKLDIRVGSILEVEKISGKTRIIKGVVDLGEEKRDVIIGGAEFYEPQDLVGKTVIVIANLETKKIAGIESNAMLLAADVNDKPFWLTVDSNVPAGTKIK